MSDRSILSLEPEHVKKIVVHFDNNLKFERHIDITCCNIKRMVGIYYGKVNT